MKKDIKEYTRKNKEAWNEVMPMHQAVSKERLDSKVVGLRRYQDVLRNQAQKAIPSLGHILAGRASQYYLFYICGKI